MIKEHIDAMVDLNVLSYHKGMQDGLDAVAREMSKFRAPIQSATVGVKAPYCEGIVDAVQKMEGTVHQLKEKSANLCHANRGEHECDEYCFSSF
jgi:hypothetical protein